MMTYLATYFAIGILFAGVAGEEVGAGQAIVAGFLWPLTLLWFVLLLWVNKR